VDAERASGHRYGQRAFLVQLRRQGSGTLVIDPAALPDLSQVGRALSSTTWVIHAASQDLPCLADVGMRPTALFDTELGGRLAGAPRVGLAAMVEQLLGLSLAKEHSAVDWSVRPLPAPWLLYAALDVEVLLELHDALAAELETQGKAEWARQEFAALAAAPAPRPRADPWRRTSGMHRVRTRRQVAAVRELWQERDAVAQERDVSPGRILPDSAIVQAAMSGARTTSALADVPGFTGRGAARYGRRWVAALKRAYALDEASLPPQHLQSDGPPPPRLWAERDPAAAARLAACRTALGDLARRHALPVENLLAPDAVRRLAWTPPPPGLDSLRHALADAGARPWQVDLTSEELEKALT
jgi:ribonuclease D